jgi:hypothetical protein
MKLPAVAAFALGIAGGLNPESLIAVVLTAWLHSFSLPPLLPY